MLSHHFKSEEACRTHLVSGSKSFLLVHSAAAAESDLLPEWGRFFVNASTSQLPTGKMGFRL